jgi:uncharacterized phiE125 gp8 family phage protein
MERNMSPKLVLVTAPTVPVITDAEAKLNLRITSSTYDDLIKAARDAAVGQFDPAAGGWLGRALRPQTWELRLNEFPCDKIELSYPPLISIVSVKYDDIDGVERTLVANTDYRVIGQGGFGKASIVPPYGKFWPSARCDHETVRVRFTCGYPAATTDPVVADTMPPPIKQAVQLATRHLWSIGEQSMFLSQRTVDGVGSRAWVVSENAQKVIERATSDLLFSLRIFS